MAGGEGPDSPSVIIRELTRQDEYTACLELQRQGFGWDELNLMPTRFFVVSQHIGGLVLGAFRGGTLIGFASSIPGIRDGQPYWHSHMLAVAPAQRDSGIGAQLKLEQKKQALARGIRRIEWTFDPLMARNAYFNIEKLGVIVRRYYPNFYGHDSDRLIAEWWLDRPRMPVVGSQRRIIIPADSSIPTGLRERVRAEFLANIKEDYFVVGFERKGTTGEYVFIPGASRADFGN